MTELCKQLPVEMVEQYRRGAYVRYAINSMEDTELHDATHVKTIIDNGVFCNATQKAMLRGWLLFRKLKSIVIIY